MPVHTHLKTPRRMDWQSVEHWPINLDASFPFTFFNLSADTYLQNVFLHRCLFCMNRCLSTSISWTVCCISTGEGGDAVKEIFLFLWRISIVVFRICYVVQFDKFNFNLEILYLWCVSIGEVCTWCISIGIFCICDAFWLVEEMQQLRMQSRGDALWMHWLPTIALHCIALIADHWSPMIHVVGIPTTLPYSIPFLPIHDPSYVILASKLPLDCSNNTFGIDLPNFWQCLGTLHMLKNVCHVGGASHIFNARSLKSEMTRSQGLRGSFSRLTGNPTW